MSKLKKFELHWEATVSGIQIVEAFDELDAEEQFDSLIHEDGMPDQPVFANLEYVIPYKPKRKRK